MACDTSVMAHVLWVLPLVAGLAALKWERLMGPALLVALVCAIVGLVHLVRRGSTPPLPQVPDGRDERDVQRDLPPGPN